MESAECSSAKEVYEATCRMMEGTIKPYTSERVHAFARVEIKGLLDPKLRDQFAAPMAIVLPGRVQDEWGDEGSGVAIHRQAELLFGFCLQIFSNLVLRCFWVSFFLLLRSAFDSPDTHSDVQTFLRRHAIGASATLLLHDISSAQPVR